jgi:hypothetical protein
LAGDRGFRSLPDRIVGAGPDVDTIGVPGMNTGADLDGDGYADLLVNDTYFVEEIAGTPEYRGRLWMVRGGPFPPPRTIEQAAALTFVADTRLPGLFGFQWNTGDFNGDGRPDVVVADHYLGDAERHDFPGGAYLFTNGRQFGARALTSAGSAPRGAGGSRRSSPRP